ncbi:MAG: Flp pilus assembly protein CpaB [Blastocatellia bacterium]|jgi:pilus assembly protein CpaB
MNKRFLLALAGAVFFGLVSIYAAKFFLESRLNQARVRQQQGVVAAAVDIAPGTRIEPQHITVTQYPRELLPEQAMIQQSEVLGRVAIAEIPARMPVLSRYLAGVGAQPGISGVTAAGMRAVSVRVDEASSVGGFVSPGTYVDVIAIMQPQLEGARQVSKVILQKVRVLAGGQQMQNRAEGKPTLVNTVTLEVTPAQAEKLKLAEAEGRLQLSIRNATDLVIETTPGATRRDVINDVALEQRALEGARAAGSAPPRSGVSGPTSEPPVRTRPVVAPASDPAPAKKPTPAPPTIELIEGAKRSQIQIIP